MKALLLAAPFNLDDGEVVDRTITLEAQAGQRRRIDVEVGATVIELASRTCPGSSKAPPCHLQQAITPLSAKLTTHGPDYAALARGGNRPWTSL